MSNNQEHIVTSHLLINEEQRAIFEDGYQHGIARATRLLHETHRHKFTWLLNNGNVVVCGCECGVGYAGLVNSLFPVTATSTKLMRILMEEDQKEG